MTGSSPIAPLVARMLGSAPTAVAPTPRRTLCGRNRDTICVCCTRFGWRALVPLFLPDSGDPRREAEQWCPFVEYARDHGLPYLEDAGYLGAPTAHQLEQRLATATPLVSAWTDGRLLHGDLEGGHVFSTPAGAFTGVIDFGPAQAGDPRWDLARAGRREAAVEHLQQVV